MSLTAKMWLFALAWMAVSCLVAWFLGRLSRQTDHQGIADEEQRRRRDEAQAEHIGADKP